MTKRGNVSRDLYINGGLNWLDNVILAEQVTNDETN